MQGVYDLCRVFLDRILDEEDGGEAAADGQVEVRIRVGQGPKPAKTAPPTFL
ncbi:MAG: hypothetical protein ACOX41_03890 [Anaerovoracaceae bacterium]|jgi:hypothetical protein